MFYNFLRYLINLFILIFRLLEKLFEKPNIIVLYPFLYVFYLVCAFTYGLTGRADALLCTFIAWVPFTVYLIELKFFKKQHGVPFYVSYSCFVLFIFLFVYLSGFSPRPFLWYLFWGYFCLMSQVVSVFLWSLFIFLVEHFQFLQRFLRLIAFTFFIFFYSVYQFVITAFLFFFWCLKQIWFFLKFLWSFF